MQAQTGARLRQAAIVVLALGALGFGALRVARSLNTGEAAAQVWFYDESEQRLYPVPSDTLPPHPGVGGRSGDGVRAVVFTPGNDRQRPEARRIAYLETYGPELKRVLDAIRAARAASRRYEGRIPDRESAFVETNTLVRRVADPQWHTAASPEGQRIVAEWRQWRGADGQPGVLSMP